MMTQLKALIKKCPSSLKHSLLKVETNIASKFVDCVDDGLEFADGISVVTIAKDEAPYIREWVQFHRAVGVDRIYLYDNGSSDEMANQISDFIENGYVVYRWYPGSAKQYQAYEDAVKRYKNATRWMAFIDADEYLMPCDMDMSIGDAINEVMKNAKPEVAGIAVNWRMYGSSSLEDKPAGGVVDSYLWRASDQSGDGNDCIKTIANPRRIFKYRHAHFPTYYAGFYSINEDGERCDGAYNCTRLPVSRLRINHYFTKSKAEWRKRRSRKVADKRFGHRRTALEIEREFIRFDKNEVFDPIAKRRLHSIYSDEV